LRNTFGGFLPRRDWRAAAALNPFEQLAGDRGMMNCGTFQWPAVLLTLSSMNFAKSICPNLYLDQCDEFALPVTPSTGQSG
jgi:hypothetical protein